MKGLRTTNSSAAQLNQATAMRQPAILLLTCWILVPTLSMMASAETDTPKDLIDRYQATDLTKDRKDQHRFYHNPWLYQGRQIYFTGGYHRHLSATQAIMAMLPGNPAITYIVVVETIGDIINAPIMGCVGEVLGTIPLTQDGLVVDVPHIQAVECLPVDLIRHHRPPRPFPQGRTP